MPAVAMGGAASATARASTPRPRSPRSAASPPQGGGPTTANCCAVGAPRAEEGSMSVRGSLRRACSWALATAVIAAGLVLGQTPDAGAEEDTRAVVTILASSVLEGDA